MRKYIRLFVSLLPVLVPVALVLALVIWYEASLWDECRHDHSWGYCARVLSQ